MKYCIALFFLLFFIWANAQKYDYNWVLGDPGGNIDILFTDTSANAISHHRNVTMETSQTTISDSSGNLLFFTNGAKVFNRHDSIMLNGDSINYGLAWSEYFGGAEYNGIQEIIALPTDTSAIWNLIHYTVAYSPDTFPYLWIYWVKESKIDMRGDSGLGKVVFKDKQLIQDTVSSYVTACQHANGRDWWVLTHQTSTNCLYTLLVQPDTVIQYPMQCLGDNYLSMDAGQAAFSPDGTKFAWVGGYSGINIYDFDRCTGLLSNPVNLPFYWTYNREYQFGLSFSPNSRFLYIAQSTYIFQFDLSESDLAASVDTVGQYIPPPDSTSAAARYDLMQLAPDGKIYITGNNSVKWMHVINQPDLKGDSCNFVNYGFRLPNDNNWGLPNYPGNYRLGPLRGSPCDTIYKTDTTGTDTTSVGFARVKNEKILKIYPNPAAGYAIIDYGFTDWSMGTNVEMEISNAINEVIYSCRLPMYSGYQRLDVSHFASGFYTVSIKRRGAVIAVNKLVVVH